MIAGMAANLFLPGLEDGFRIPERDADSVRAKLRKAMQSGEVVEIATAPSSDSPLVRPVVTVNGASLAWFTVVVSE